MTEENESIDELREKLSHVIAELNGLHHILADIQQQLADLRKEREDQGERLKECERVVKLSGSKEIGDLVTNMGATVTLLSRIVQGDSALGHKGINTRILENEDKVTRLDTLKSKLVWVLIGIGVGNVVQLGYILKVASEMTSLLGLH